MVEKPSVVLYIKTGCPYCLKVENFLSGKGWSVPIKNKSEDEEARQYLISRGGKEQVPCLFIDGQPLYESNDIIQWFEDNWS